MKDLQDLELLVNMGIPVIAMQTGEEKRAAELVQRISTRTGRTLFHWSVTRGLRNHGNSTALSNTQKPLDVLQYIARQNIPGLFVLYDFHPWMDDPTVVRLIREIAQTHDSVSKTLFIVGANIELPQEISNVSSTFEMMLPSRQDLETMIYDESASWGEKNRKRVQATKAVVDSLVRVLSGLPTGHARRLIRSAIYDDGILSDDDIPEVIKTKYRLLDSDGVLSYEFDHVDLDQVAGLTRLKEWLNLRRDVFLSDNAPTGLDPPKGLLLLGVQGGGKSLAAKAVAGSWKLPLLRLDFATLYNKYYGETERNLRESLNAAQAMAPCVLWIDEIEKGLSADNEGGPSKRILGTLLTWMAEHEEKVFLVATANDIESLPPELLRKGRFDEIFFVDLPGPEVRQKIFEIHLKKREQDIGQFNIELLAQQADGFTGAEIEQAVVSALYSSHAQKGALTTELIIKAISDTQPLSVVMKEKIQYLREWASERTVSAD